MNDKADSNKASDPIVSKEPFPKYGIEHYKSPQGEWGYLLTRASGQMQFTTDERPSESEIMKRWGARLNGSPMG